VERTEAFNATARVDPVHGDETLGLGTSTFLEGAPASRTAMQRRESETEANLKSGGLQRKKSLAQKIRGINRAGMAPSGRVMSPEPTYEVGTALTTKDAQEDHPQPTLTGSTKKANENNPFFNTHDSAWDRKGESIAIADQEKTGRTRAPSSPRKGLERRPTAENGSSPDGIGKGLLQRVKSLKGGARRVRPSEKPQA
jgi:Pal1 cell morphology protein